MNWSRLADLFDRALTTPLSLPGVEGTVFVADEAPALEALLEEGARTEADRAALDEDGWYVVRDFGTLREVLSFEYFSDALVWWLLEGEEGRRYLLYATDEEPVVAFARLEGDPRRLLGPVIERFLATNGEAFGVAESFTMLPDRVNNAAPELLAEASVRAGTRAFLAYAEERYDGWSGLSPVQSAPQTPEEKEAAFADYWQRSYIGG